MKPIFSRTLLALVLAVSAQPLLGRYTIAQIIDDTPPAATAHDVGSLTVKASVATGCALTTTGGNAILDFGDVGSAGVNKDVSAEFSIRCTATLPYTIGLGAGESATSTVAARKMTKRVGATDTGAATGAGASDVITYQLYKSVADRTSNTYWTQSGEGTLASPTGGASGTTQTVPIYGRVPVQTASPSTGFYQDVVRIYMNY